MKKAFNVLFLTIIVALVTICIFQSKKINTLNETIKSDNLWMDIQQESLNYWYNLNKEN